MSEYKPEHRAQILEFFPDAPFKNDIWNWQYETNPGALACGFSPIVKLDDQGVSGFNGVMPVSIKYGQDVVEGLWSCDFYVDVRVRGKGLGKEIKQELLKRAPVILSFGVSPTAAIVLEKMGWSKSPEVWSFRRIITASSFKDRAIQCLQSMMKLAFRIPLDLSLNFTFQSELPNAREVNALWQEAAPTYRKIVCRTYDYLNWRYQKHPLASYEFLVARDESGKLQGMLVLREHEGVVRVVDYIGCSDRPSMLKSMMKAAVLRYDGVRLWLAVTSDPALKRVFLSEGFFLTRSTPKLYVHSPRGLGGVKDAGELGWFVMGGDSDGEFLSAARDNWLDVKGYITSSHRGS